MSFTAFIHSHGIPETQLTASGKTCLVFTNPKNDKETFFSISEKLGITQENADDVINEKFADLQVCETEVPEDILAERQAREEARLAALEAGKRTYEWGGKSCEASKPVQMESYVLCPKGQGTRKKLNLAFLQD